MPTDRDKASAIREAFANGLHLQQAGRLVEAEQAYRQVLALDPRHADSLHSLGVIAFQAGRPDLAGDYFSQAITANNAVGAYHSDLGVALKAQGRVSEAIACFRTALDLEPDFPLAHNNLGNALRYDGNLEQAEGCYRHALQLKPDYAEAHCNLGAVLQHLGRSDEAELCYRRALEISPNFAQAYTNLGVTLEHLGRTEEAEANHRRALELAPDFADAYSNLGNTLQKLRRFDEAEASYRRALAIKPDMCEVYSSLGIVLQHLGRLDEAEANQRRALELKPKDPTAHNNLGALLQARGQIKEALAHYERAVSLDPGYVQAHSNLLYALAYSSITPPEELLRASRLWYQRHGARLKPAHPHISANRDAHRRLRIGFVSPDFRNHAVSYFIEPIFRALDRTQLELHAYANVAVPDSVTERLQGVVDHFTSIAGQNDEQVADLIRRERIDILIDLAGHTAGNRLQVFARRPAPVQATYLGYFATTGMPTIDYWITDSILHPDHTSERTVETLWRLPRCWVCYSPVPDAPDVAMRTTDAPVTFGSFNNLAKLNSATIGLWSSVLRALPETRLLLKTRGLDDGIQQERVRASFAAAGVAPERISLAGHTSSYRDHLAAYGDIDIVLDPTPYTGGTTTADALWMGAPVLTLAGERMISRMSMSMLAALGLNDWVATSEEEYVAKAMALASARPVLAELRHRLRQRMANSPLCDASGLARVLEDAFRSMWIQYLK